MLGPIHRASGVALRAGPESALTARLPGRLDVAGSGIWVTEVPVPGGVVDAIMIQSSHTTRELTHLAVGARPLVSLTDGPLAVLASLDCGRPYRIDGLLSRGVGRATLRQLVTVGALEEEGCLVRRHPLLPDSIRRVTSFEVKASDASRVAVQAARRSHLVDQSYIVFPSPMLSRWPLRTRNLLATHGVGVIDWDSGRKILRARSQGRPSVWSRFQVARAIAPALAAEIQRGARGTVRAGSAH